MVDKEKIDDIRFFIPQEIIVPLELEVTVNGNHVKYEPIHNNYFVDSFECAEPKKGFIFETYTDTEEEAVMIVKKVIDRIISEHNKDESNIPWKTKSLKSFHRASHGYKDDKTTIITWEYEEEHIGREEFARMLYKKLCEKLDNNK